MEARIPELDGLRAVAILLVIAWHYIGIPGGPSSIVWNVFYLGHFGVDLFFVLSGFLISSILINTRERPDYFRAFYTRRALRIWPLYLALVAIFLLGRGRNFDTGLFSGAVPAWTYLFLIQNFWMASLQTYGAFWLAGTWSLAIEEQFYLVFPLVVRLLPLRLLPMVLVALILICPILRIVAAFHNDGYGYYVLLHYRADVLAIGALIAWLRKHGRTEIVPAAPILITTGCAIPLIVFTGSDNFDAASWQHTLSGIFFGALLLVVLKHQGAPALGWLRGGICAFFAKTSYCAYLIHHIVAYDVFARAHIPRSNDTLSGIILTAVSFAATSAIAAASYRWLERPLLEIGRSHTSKVAECVPAKI